MGNKSGIRSRIGTSKSWWFLQYFGGLTELLAPRG